MLITSTPKTTQSSNADKIHAARAVSTTSEKIFIDTNCAFGETPVITSSLPTITPETCVPWLLCVEYTSGSLSA